MFVGEVNTTRVTGEPNVFPRHVHFVQYCTVGYNEFDFFLKLKNTDPLMGAKLKSKTHLLNTFFDFLSRFLRVRHQSLQKVLI
jgi:hypothetical protein